MIRCRVSHLESRCRERGYTLDEVRPCIVSEDGDRITVDETHPAYPRANKAGTLPEHAIAAPHAGSRPVKVPESGPGTELKKLLGLLGFMVTPTCKCNKRAKYMDEMGLDWCRANIETISGWLKEEAEERKLPYLEVAGKKLIQLAIYRARKSVPKPDPGTT